MVEQPVHPPGGPAPSPSSGRTGVLLITSGRLPYLVPCVRSLRRALPARVDHVCIVDTAHRPVTARLLAIAARLGTRCDHVHLPGAQLREAVLAGWKNLSDGDVRWVFHVEEDFLFVRRIDLPRLIRLATPATRCQALLLRQRWYASDYRHPSMLRYLEANYDGTRTGPDAMEVSLFSFNPSVYELSRLRKVADSLDATSSENYEMQLAHRVVELGLRAVVDTTRESVPAVLHLGAVITTKHNAMIAGRRGTTFVGYTTVHGRRLVIVIGRLVSERITRLRSSQPGRVRRRNE